MTVLRRVDLLAEFRAGPTVVSVDDEGSVGDTLRQFLTAYSESKIEEYSDNHADAGGKGLGRLRSRIRREAEPSLFDFVPIRFFPTRDREEFLQTVTQKRADIVLIDLHLDSGRRSAVMGLDLIADIYARDVADIIVYTSEAERNFGQACYERGADDFIQKGATPKDVRNRIIKQWRKICEQRSGGVRPNVVKFGSWLFDRNDRFLVADDGRRVRLSISEHKFLACFANDPSSLMDPQTFELFVSDKDETPTEQKMHSFANRLRFKLGPNFPLQNERGRGYRISS